MEERFSAQTQELGRFSENQVATRATLFPRVADLLRQGKENLQAPWLGITGFVVLAGLLTLLVFVGEAARDAFDPRKSRP